MTRVFHLAQVLGILALHLFSTCSFAHDENVNQRFTHQHVIDAAKSLAEKPFQAPQEAPEALTKLDYSTYRLINFQQQSAIWGKSPTPFSIQLFAPGFLYKNLVNIDIVENGMHTPVRVTKSSFRTPTEAIAKLLEEVDHYAGFRLHYPLNRPDYKDEFVVFQGASYFRATSEGQIYGLSARGLAINVAGPKGEEHPMFTHFWIERPGTNQHNIVVHALLDSESVSGAYRFGIYPNNPTRMDVNVTLFPRRDVPQVGLSPLTSMFLHNNMVPPRFADYRPAVHDSQGLAVLTGNNEHLWRPLNNPETLQISAFIDQNPQGFGLIQRNRNFQNYQDLEAQYHKRPSLWVKPLNDWGKGQVELVEIPSDYESNDNIIVYWHPEQGLKKGQRFEYAYRLSWPKTLNRVASVSRVVRSAGGLKLQNNHHQEIVIDYSPLDITSLENIHINASINTGKIMEKRLQSNPYINGGRVFITFDPESADVAELRVQLSQGDKPISETWLHRWIKPKRFTLQ